MEDMIEISSWLVASGIASERIYDYIEPRFLLPDKEEDPPPAAFTPFHILGALCCLAIILPIALIFFAFEITHKHAKKAVKQRKTKKEEQSGITGQSFARYHF